MPSNEERYSKQLERAEDILESDSAAEMLKVHYDCAKPSFALSRWLLAVTGAVAAALLANASAAAEMLGRGWLFSEIVLLLAAGIMGLLAVYLEGVIVARVAGQLGTLTFTEAVIQKFERYNRDLASFAERLGIQDRRIAEIPDQKIVSEWFRYPNTWCTRWAYGKFDYSEKGASYKYIVMLFSRQACASRLQLLLVTIVFGVALVDIGWQQARELLPVSIKTASQATSPAVIDQDISVKKE